MFTMFAKDFTGCFSHCCVEGVDNWIQVCLCCSWWWEVQTSRLSQLGRFPTHWNLSVFEVGLVRLSRSCVFWLADSFQAKVEEHYQQVMVTSDVCSWQTTCSGTVHSWSEALPHQLTSLSYRVFSWAAAQEPRSSEWFYVCKSNILYHSSRRLHTRSNVYISTAQLGPELNFAVHF